MFVDSIMLSLRCFAFVACVAVAAGSIRSVIVPLLFGELFSHPFDDFEKIYTCRAHTGVETTARCDSLMVFFKPRVRSMVFSGISIDNMPVNVTAAHIHGPCADATPCSDGSVVYTICSPCPARNDAGTITIPSFSVDPTQLNDNFSTAFGLYEGIMYSNKLYYLNFHTER
jgi:hypothetical protein